MLIDGTSIMYRAYYKLLGIIMLLMCYTVPGVSLTTFDWANCSKVESWSSDSR